MKEKLKSLLSPRQKKFILSCTYSWRWPWNFFFCKVKGLPWHHSWKFWGMPIVQTKRRGSIRIGKNFVACSNPKHNSLGVFQKVILKTLRPDATITIGKGVGVSGATISAATSITIGDRVLIGTGALITDSDAHPLNPEYRIAFTGQTQVSPVVIKDDVFVGARTIILKGVTIGRGAVIGAGSVVCNDVKPCTIVAGNPARELGD